MDTIKVLLFSKEQNVFCDYAEAILRSCFESGEYISVRGKVGDPLDEKLCTYHPDYIISFVSPWIIPGTLLDSARTAAINFHPGSPEYPGIGCYNFALYENNSKYGVTAHYMKEKVDSGDIIMTSYFDIAPFETVETLKLKSMNHLLYCYEKILSYISQDIPLPVSNETWKRKPFTRKEMLGLFEIDPQKHDEAEIERRIRAAAYPGNTGAYVTVANHKFYLPHEDRRSIVD
jgi:Methionyl-tRNA formyltransferase